MAPNRREFLWTMGTAAGAFALLPLEQVFWAPEAPPDVGWAPGIEKWVPSTCTLCPAHCGITGRVVDGRLVRIIGNPLHPMSRGGVCARGLAGVQTLYHPERLASPMVRVGERGSGQWEPISLEKAVERMGDALRDLRADGRPQELVALTGHKRGTLADLWRQFFQAYGSPNYVAEDHADGTDAVMAVMHGIPRRPSYDLEASDMVMSFGAPLFESWWSPLQAHVAFGRPGTEGSSPRRFVQVDHRFSRTAAHTDEWVGVRARTHAVLALGMAYVILRDRLYNEEFVAQHVSGLDDFTDARGHRREGFRSLILERYRTEEVSAITGVPVDRITGLARAFASARAPVAVCGSDVTSAPDGLSAGMAVHALNLLTGSINRPGGVLFGAEAPLAPLPQVSFDEVSRQGIEVPPLVEPAVFGAGDTVTRLAESLAGSEGAASILLIHAADPLGHSARSELWQRALARVPFVVSFSPFLDATTRQADLIVPDLLPYERWQDAPAPLSYPYPAWGITKPMVSPHEGGTHTGEVVMSLAATLGGSLAESLPTGSFDTLLRERARGLFDARRGRSFADAFDLENHRQQEERGWWLGTQDEFEGFWSELVERGGWTDPFHDLTDPDRLTRKPSGRIELIPQEVVQRLEDEGEGLRLYGHGGEDSGNEAFPLRLIPYRVSTLSSADLGLERWIAEQPVVSPDVQWAPFVTLAPVTAEALGLADGISVYVVSAVGRYRARLKISLGTPPLTVCAPHGMRHPDGEVADPLRILDPVLDPLTGVSSWFTTFVRVEPAQGSIA